MMCFTWLCLYYIILSRDTETDLGGKHARWPICCLARDLVDDLVMLQCYGHEIIYCMIDDMATRVVAWVDGLYEHMIPC